MYQLAWYIAEMNNGLEFRVRKTDRVLILFVDKHLPSTNSRFYALVPLSTI